MASSNPNKTNETGKNPDESSMLEEFKSGFTSVVGGIKKYFTPQKSVQGAYTVSKYPINILEPNCEVSHAIKFTAQEFSQDSVDPYLEAVGQQGKAIIMWECFLPIPHIQETEDHSYENYQGMGLLQGSGMVGSAAGDMMRNGITDASKTQLGSAAGKFAKTGFETVAAMKALSGLQEFAGSDFNTVRRTLMNGSMLNPLNTTIYSGSGLKQYSFDFHLMVRNERETQELNTMVKNFKNLARPEASSVLDVLTMKHPCVWGIEFKHGSAPEYMEDPLPKFKTCVLTQVNVSYGEGQPVFIRQTKNPVEYTLTLVFREMFQHMRGS